MADKTGNVVWSADYDAYGKAIASPAPALVDLMMASSQLQKKMAKKLAIRKQLGFFINRRWSSGGLSWMSKQEPLLILVRAFFLERALHYRTYPLPKIVKAKDVEVLLGRARGRADLNRRSYSVSKSLSTRLSEIPNVTIEWDFKQFFYQIGIFQAAGQSRPEGFLLTCRSAGDGSVIRHFAAVNPFSVSSLVPLANRRALNQYQSIYLGDTLSPIAAEIFPELEQFSPKKAFFELTPILRSHEDFYLQKHGLNFPEAGTGKRPVGAAGVSP